MRNVATPAPPSFLDDTIFIHGTGGGSNLWVPRHYEFVAQQTLTELDFSDVSPVDGIIVGSRKQKLAVAVDVLLVE